MMGGGICYKYLSSWHCHPPPEDMLTSSCRKRKCDGRSSSYRFLTSLDALPSHTHTTLPRSEWPRSMRLHSAKLVCSSYVTNEEPLQAGWHIQPVGMHAVDYARSRKKCSRGQTHSPEQNKLLKITVRQKRVCQAVHLLSMRLLT